MALPTPAYAPPATPDLSVLQRPTCEIYAWGRNEVSQTGTPSPTGTDVVEHPSVVRHLGKKSMTAISGNIVHSAFVTVEGDLYMCGSNEDHQLARKAQQSGGDGSGAIESEPTTSPALELHVVQTAACGSTFTVAATRRGQLLGWGNGEFGQLGAPAVVSQVMPRVIQAPELKGPGIKIERLAAGASHVLALSSRAQVYSFGGGMHGALGHGDAENRDAPSLIQAIWPICAVAIAAGDDHSLALAADGRVFSWGRGKYGALGHGDEASQHMPREIEALEGHVIRRIAAGGSHSIAISDRRRVYSWGRNASGQLALGHTEDVTTPLVVNDSQSWQIGEVSAGSRHTLLLSDAGAIYGCGSTDQGQLATLSNTPVTVPCRIMLPAARGGSAPVPVTVLAAGDHSMAVCSSAGRDSSRSGSACTSSVSSTPVPLPNLLALARACAPGPEGQAPPPDRPARIAALIDAIHAAFTTPGALLAGFTLPQSSSNEPLGDGPEAASTPGLDLDAIAEVFSAILLALESDVVLALRAAVISLLDSILKRGELTRLPGSGQSGELASMQPSSMSRAQWIKVLIILLQNPINADMQSGAALLPELLARVAFAMQPRARKLLMRWLASLPAAVRGGRIVRPLQRHISDYVKHNGWPKSRAHVMLVGSLMYILHTADKQSSDPVPYTQFHNVEVSEAVMPSLQAEWVAWQQVKQELVRNKQDPGRDPPPLPPRSLCQLPFLMTPECKKVILQGEAMLLQNHEMHHSLERLVHYLHQGAVLFREHLAHIGRLNIEVRRDHLLEDALQQLQLHAADIRKPLKVTFVGSNGVKEEGVDEGGVSKEFFQLLVRELFAPMYGMFEYNEETREYWFSPAAMEMGASPSDFRLVGKVLGLGIFNGIILDVHFPLIVYKKLLGGKPTLDDLKDAQPSLAKGLQALLDYDGDDVEDVFCQTFETSYRLFDTVKVVELEPGGSNRPVTKLNRQEYVDRIVAWTLEESVKEPFEEFRQGFYSVASGSSLVLFNHHELELVVCGLPHLDFHELEKNTRYEGGFSAETPAIKSFWKVIHEMTLEQKKRFLAFVTGCDRAPMGGLGKLNMMIQRSGPDAERLPTAHTCFNVLLMPEYNSEEKMRRMLLTAINNAEGFGLQ